MPDTYGKRQRQGVKARKAAAREERRIARKQRREEGAEGVEPRDDMSWLGEPNPSGVTDMPSERRED